METIVLLIVLYTVVTLAVSALVVKIVANRQYWKGRGDGWRACENMAMKRAKEHGYDMDTFLSEILQ